MLNKQKRYTNYQSWFEAFSEAPVDLCPDSIVQEMESAMEKLSQAPLKTPINYIFSDQNQNTKEFCEQINDSSFLVIPFGRLLVNTICQLLQGNQFQVRLIIDKSIELPLIRVLKSLPSLSFLSPQLALEAINAPRTNQHPVVYISCPELHPTSLKTGHKVTINSCDYMFSMFETLFCFKSKRRLQTFTFKEDKLCFQEYQPNEQISVNDQVMAMNQFIFSNYKDVVSHKVSQIYSWHYLQLRSVRTLSLQEIKKINLTEGLIRAKLNNNLQLNSELNALMESLKDLKTKAFRNMGVQG